MKNMVLVLLMVLMLNGVSLAIPEMNGLRVTDVTTTSFSLVWMSNTMVEPAVHIYRDAALKEDITDTVTIIPMPDISADIAAAAKSKGNVKVKVVGLSSGSRYYVKAVAKDPADPTHPAYSAAQEVITATEVSVFRRADDGSLLAVANDLLTVKAYFPPQSFPMVTEGDLVVLESPGSRYPLSAFVGAGIAAPEGILDLNNLFTSEGSSLFITGGERAVLRIYRGSTLSLLHYRKFATNTAVTGVTEPVRGFFADINLDGAVDEADFLEFKKQYRMLPADTAYNPDYNFFDDPDGVIDAGDFARFAAEYGRKNVQ